jgi:hypothetical protein
MPSKIAVAHRMARLALALGLLTGAGPAVAQETVLYSFCSVSNCTDGSDPRAPLALSTGGILYGTTNMGGANSYGAVFGLTPGGNGTWTATVVYSFCSRSNCEDGRQPPSGPILDAGGKPGDRRDVPQFPKN